MISVNSRNLFNLKVTLIQSCPESMSGKDKTAADTGRVVPLNQRALGNPEILGAAVPSSAPEDYVFPSEKVGAAGEAFDAKVYDTDPTKPVGSIKEAWETAKTRTRRHCPHCKAGILVDKPRPEEGYVCVECKAEMRRLPVGLVSVRFHDLRHSAVSRMIAAGVPLPIIAKIVGWSAGTMAKMAVRYGHFGIEELRGGVEAISSTARKIEEGYPQLSPQSDSETSSDRAN